MPAPAPAPSPAAAPAPSPSQPAPAQAAPATPPANLAQQHLATAFEYAKSHGQQLLDSTANFVPRVYYWYVDPAECTLVGGDRARCITYTWTESRTGNGGLERVISRIAVFAIWLEGSVYTMRTQSLDLFADFDGGGPFHVVCSDARIGATRCT